MHFKADCKVCSGVGKVSGLWTICSDCKGMGAKDAWKKPCRHMATCFKHDCIKCSGRGWFPPSNSTATPTPAAAPYSVPVPFPGVHVKQKEFGDHGTTLRNNEQLSNPSGSSCSSSTMLISANQKYRLVAQDDGNVVVYEGKSNALWGADCHNQGRPPYRLHMQIDNNLVMYDSSNKAIWSSGGYNKGQSGAYGVMQDDGNFVVYDGTNKPMWCTRTDNGRKSPHPGKGDTLM